ncbi:hypothetical protein FHV99_004688 [Ochrobactrum sp. P20RRXII]|nr:hypothetical protein [Ochrobactrum sp. P20RRXII]NIH77436.1 hypothetical protein [Ochrobactrum sp. P20RRXII]
MINALHIDFDATTGQIIRWGVWQVDDFQKLPMVAAKCERAIFEVEPGEAYDLSNCYIDLNSNPVKLKNLKSFDAPGRIELKIGETVEIADLPAGATVELNGVIQEIAGSALTLEGEMEASYVLQLKAPTYKTRIVEVVVQNAA